MEHRAIIWDVDGTLVDTAELHYKAWTKLAQEGKFPFTREDFSATFGWRNQEIIPKLFGMHDQNTIDDLSQRKEEYYRAAARNGVQLLPGVRPLLENLHRAGFLQAIGSSAPRENVDLIMDLTQTGRFFTAVVSMEDTQRGKPDPEVFLLAARKLGVPPSRCLVVEDAPAGIQAAKAGGMRALAVTFVAHHPEIRLRQAGADLIVSSLENVSLELIDSLSPG